MRLQGIIKITASFIMFFAVCASTTSARADANSTAKYKITKDNFTGCQRKEFNEKLTQYAIQNDYVAFEKAVNLGIAIGQCARFTEGETVFVTDTAIFSGLVRVRKPEGIAEYWVPLDAVKKK